MLSISTNLWDRIKFPTKVTRDLVYGLVLGITISISSTTLAWIGQKWRKRQTIVHLPPRPIEIRSEEVVDGVIGLIGESGRGLITEHTAEGREYPVDQDKFIERCFGRRDIGE